MLPATVLGSVLAALLLSTAPVAPRPAELALNTPSSPQDLPGLPALIGTAACCLKCLEWQVCVCEDPAAFCQACTVACKGNSVCRIDWNCWCFCNGVLEIESLDAQVLKMV